MAGKSHRLAVFIGRFQPFHNGHRAVMASAADHADSLLNIIGSAERPRSWKNPFSFEERKTFIEKGTADINLPIHALPLVDTLYDDQAWADNVRLAVDHHIKVAGHAPSDVDVALIGMEKDQSSAYLNWFPEWEMVPTPAHYHDGVMVNATDMRELLFYQRASHAADLVARFGASHVGTVQDWMARNPKDHQRIKAEGDYVKAYGARLKAAEEVWGYPISINTADCVIQQAGHVLLIKRKSLPGKSLWALPGGHIDAGETAHQAALRELFEECSPDITIQELDKHLVKRQIFDHPDRSEKGWVRTEAFLFNMPDYGRLLATTSGDDAAETKWAPLHEIRPEILFEDHFDILQTMIPDLPFSYTKTLLAHSKEHNM